MTIPTGAIQPVFYCPGFLSMVFYVKKETVPRVFRVVNWRAFYYCSTTFDGRDESKFNTTIQPFNTAIIRHNGGVELILGGFYDTMQPNHG